MLHANPVNDSAITSGQDLDRAMCSLAALIDYRLRLRSWCGGESRAKAVERRAVSLHPSGIMLPVELDPVTGIVSFGDGASVVVRGFWEPGQAEGTFWVDDGVVHLRVGVIGSTLRLMTGDLEFTAIVRSPRAAQLAEVRPGGVSDIRPKHLCAPLPGVLVKLFVAAGDRIGKGETVAIVEAMKMENRLSAAYDMVVRKVIAPEGSVLQARQPILEYHQACMERS